MTTAGKLVGFLIGLVLVFVGAFGVGRAVAPERAVDNTVETGGQHPAHSATSGQTSAAVPAHSHGGSDGAAPAPPGGLTVSQDGYTLQLRSPATAPGAATELALTVLYPDGTPVTSYADHHGEPLHLIVVRRDLAGFQRLHPTLGGDGVWRTPMTFPAAGDYRVIADFVPDGRAGPIVLGADLAVPGDYRPSPLPPPALITQVDGYTVRLYGDIAEGTDRLQFSVDRAGRPVIGLEPYLAEYGHLVVLRSSDLGYLPAQSFGAPGDARGTLAGPTVSFTTEIPSPGSYRLYLQFRHAGAVHTAEFTVTVPGES